LRNDGHIPAEACSTSWRNLPSSRSAAWDAAELDVYGALLVFVLQGPPIRDLVMLQWSFWIDVGDRLSRAVTVSTGALTPTSKTWPTSET
jgi:hypothetical protein